MSTNDDFERENTTNIFFISSYSYILTNTPCCIHSSCSVNVFYFKSMCTMLTILHGVESFFKWIFVVKIKSSYVCKVTKTQPIYFLSAVTHIF